MVKEIDIEKCNFRNFRSCDLDLDLGSGHGNIGTHIWSRSTTHQITSKSEKLFCGCMEGRTDVCTDTPDFTKSIRSSPSDDLKIKNNEHRKSGQKLCCNNSKVHSEVCIGHT